jgi:hypothetical protein
MALRSPHATWVPLGPQTQPRMRAHDVVCLHTMAGTFAGTRATFLANGYGGTESHYGVAGSGYAEQWQDRAFTADANLDGNPRVLSIETADMGESFPRGPWSNPPWTQEQLVTLSKIVAWECSPAAHADCPPSWRCHREGIPLVRMTNSNQRGVGYHRLGCDGNFPKTGLHAGRTQRGGGEKWSKALGKLCPGDARIDQVDLVIEMARKITNPTAPAAPAAVLDIPEDDMRGDIEGFYRYLIGREGSTEDVDAWAVSSAVEGLTRKQVVGRFLDSRAEAATVVAAFRQFLKHDPNPSQVDAWLVGNPTVRQVRDGIANSPAAKGAV